LQTLLTGYRAGTGNPLDYEQLGYDAGSNVTSFRNRAGETTGFTFDALDRLTLKDLPGSEPDVSYTYDLAGRMTGASQTGNALTFTYDALGRNLTQSGPYGTVISAFDLVGRRLRITHPDGFYVAQDYLITGEMKSIRENGAVSGVGVLATFAYDDLGRRTSLTRGNGTSMSYSYDAVSRLASLTDNPAGTTHDQTLGFGYNPASQIVSNTRSNDLFSWAGNSVGTTASTANGLNQITVHGGTNTAHDARRLVQITLNALWPDPKISTDCAPPITQGEAAASEQGNRDSFWGSRAARGDPMAATALAIVNNSSDLGRIANMRLRDAITTRSPQMSRSAVSAEVQLIGVQLMRALWDAKKRMLITHTMQMQDARQDRYR
jgi:YD repeat-containing protein